MFKIDKRLDLLLKGLLAALALGFLIHFVELDEILAVMAGADPWWIAAAVLLLPLNLALENEAWYRLLRRPMPEARWGEALGAMMSGYVFGFFTPARTGEMAGRAFYLPFPDKWMLGAVVFEQRMMDLIVGVNFGLPALLYFIQQETLEAEVLWQGFAVFGAGMSVTLTALALFPRFTYRLLRRLIPLEKVTRHLTFLRATTTGTMAYVLTVTAARYVVYTTQFLLLLFALAPAVPVVPAYIGIALVFYAKFVIPSVTLLDVGVREGAAVFFLAFFGIDEAVAFNASFLLFLINILLPAAAGLPYVFRMRLGGRAAAATPTTLKEQNAS